LTTVNCPIDEVWKFLSSPGHLNNITPSNLQFEIQSDLPDKMYNGLLINWTFDKIRGTASKWEHEQPRTCTTN
jgi:ligand-binding SRPBCC domain-containing protein